MLVWDNICFLLRSIFFDCVSDVVLSYNAEEKEIGWFIWSWKHCLIWLLQAILL